MRIWRRTSVRARAAVCAALASVLVFGPAAVWAGEAAYQQWMPNAEAKALREATLLDAAITSDDWAGAIIGNYQQSAYALVLADGSWARHDRIGESPLVFLPPMPNRYSDHRSIGDAETVRIGLPDGVGYDISTPVGPNPTDRTLTFLRRRGQLWSSADLERLTGRQGLPPQQVTTYVVVNDIEARASAARLTTVLGRYVVPGGALFVGLVTWVVIGLALRPVEAIRRRMARIGGGAFHERVPVPPARDGITRLAVTTNETLERLEQAIAEQRRLVADASHELRTPIAVLRTSLEVALAHPDDIPWPEVVAEALADTERLQALADDLLLLSRTDEQQAPGEPVDLHDLLSEQAAERAWTGSRKVRVLALESAVVAGDELLLARAVRNLLDNACRFAAAEVTVALRVTAGQAELTVADDGPGIPAADRERIFERFVRLDEARDREHGGAGLGLALVRGIARGLDGTAAAVEPAAGHGAELVLRLPVLPAGPEDPFSFGRTPPHPV
ncbi:ATP-binding protein [Kitasatospora sp. NPDC002040]|uniref:sensor histidine kinase n=1 Tax=Kitasatospora sp. NPDC002040 TaxID=3154661 RepID=UPI00332970BC